MDDDDLVIVEPVRPNGPAFKVTTKDYVVCLWGPNEQRDGMRLTWSETFGDRTFFGRYTSSRTLVHDGLGTLPEDVKQEVMIGIITALKVWES